MDRIITTLAIAMSCLFGSVSAEIIETLYMHELLNHVTEQTLIIFDIDNTIMRPSQQLGSDQWFNHRKIVHLNTGLTKNEALEIALAEWMAVQSITHMQLAEEQTQEIIANLQREGFSVMGLTTRGLGLSTTTIRQLKTLDVDLTATAPAQKDIFFDNKQGTLFRQGILFTAGSDKGTALQKFLELAGFKPEAILFINDKASHLTPIERYCKEVDIPFKGLRYGYVDEWVNSFRKEPAAIQWLTFGQILCDDDAERLAEKYHHATN